MNSAQIIESYFVSANGNEIQIDLTNQPNLCVVHHEKGKQKQSYSIFKIDDSTFHIIINNKSFFVEILNQKETFFEIKVNGHWTFALECETSLQRRLKQMGLNKINTTIIKELKSPMPGLVKSVLVEPGQEVEKGAPLLILEAMKMENVIKAPASVTISEVLVQPNEPVEKNVVLIRFA